MKLKHRTSIKEQHPNIESRPGNDKKVVTVYYPPTNSYEHVLLQPTTTKEELEYCLFSMTGLKTGDIEKYDIQLSIPSGLVSIDQLSKGHYVLLVQPKSEAATSTLSQVQEQVTVAKKKLAAMVLNLI